MKKFANFIKWFSYITVGICIVCWGGYIMEGMKVASVHVFGMILLSAFVTTLATILLLPEEEDRKLKSGIRFALHYIVLCTLMSILGMWFGWIEAALSGVGKMVIYVGLVYLLAFGAYYIIDIKQADAINRKLKEKYGDKNEPF